MRNFGDLLFPVLAQERLAPLGFQITAHAPTTSDPGLGLTPPRSVSDLSDPDLELDGILIGGGYIIHTQPISALVHLQGGDATQATSDLADCWAGASLAGLVRDLPVAWNAPGVPFPFTSGQKPVIALLAQMADYFSLRDAGSARLMEVAGDHAPAIVPDPVAELSRLWHARNLKPVAAGFRARTGVNPDQPILAIHIRDRSLSGLGAERLGRMISEFCDAQGLFPILMGLGQAHDDGTTARLVAQTITVPHLVYDAPQSLTEMAAVLATARAYVGASLHGYIAATSYGVPSALVARPGYGKFAGFVEQTGWDDDLCRDWPAALTRTAGLLSGPVSRPLPDRIGDALDRHWATIAETFSNPPARSPQRNDLLRAYLQLGMQRRTLSWGTQPLHLLSKRTT